MVINFLSYVEERQAYKASLKAESEAEKARRIRLELFLANMIAQLQAA